MPTVVVSGAVHTPGDVGGLGVRPAVASDRDAVLAFCQHTFDWGDYIHEAWDGWLTDADGILLVAATDGQPVAVGHTTLVSPTEAWLEGLRVHPDYRRQGIADLMNRTARDWARAQGARVARLGTWPENAPARRHVERLGFRPVADFTYFVAPPTASPTGTGRIAGAADRDGLVARWSASDLRRTAGSLWAVGWAWRVMTAADVLAHVDRGTALVSGPSFALVHDSSDSVRVCWLDGPPEGWPHLLAGARSRAAAGGLENVSGMAPARADVAAAYAAAGFEVESALRVYEIALPT